MSPSYSFSINDANQIGEARRFANNICLKLMFDSVRQGRVSIIINELCTNLVKYSKGGQILIREIERIACYGVEIIAIDRGPGIENINQVLIDGFSTGSSQGSGLGAVKRQSDEFDIYSQIGQGTVIVAVVYSSDNYRKTKYSISAITVPMKGETVSGDSWCVIEKENQISVIMVDGLGHGPLANQAALEAVDEFIKREKLEISLSLTAIHNRLRGSRGGAVFLAQWSNEEKIDFVGVGNIRTVIQTKDQIKTLISQNGTAGIRIPNFKVFSENWNGDGVLIFHSDGITSRWDLTKYPGIMNCHVGTIAGIIFRDANRGTDDTTVLVVGRSEH